MPEHEDTTDTTLPDPFSGKRRMNPNSLANLAPRFQKGHSGNPGGLTADGKPTKTAALEAHLQRKLLTRKGSKTWAERVVDAWVEGAAKGDAASRRDLLERLYPVPQDEAGKRVVLEGLKLELTPGGGASVTMQRASGALPAPSFADSTGKESYGGTAAPSELGEGVSMPLLEAPSPLLEASDTPTSRSVPDA